MLAHEDSSGRVRMKGTIEHQCSNCGAAMSFDIGSQMVVCQYCGAEYDPRSILVDEGSKEAEDSSLDLAENGGEDWEDGDLDSLDEYSCGTCGSGLYTERTTSATVCPFCGNPVILKGRLEGSLRPDKVIPFKFDREKALEALDRHYRKRCFVPRGFKEESMVDEIKGLYVPYWVYSADIYADMGYTAVKEHTILLGKHGDVKERKYYHVRREGRISYDHLPADASTKMPDDLMDSLEPFNISEADSFKTDYLSGYVADKYDVPQEDVLPRMRRRIANSVDKAFKNTVEGYDEVSLSSSDIRAERSDADYVLYPIWLFNMRWDEKMYTFAMNGQTGKVAGDIPVDRRKLGIFSVSLFCIIMAVLFWSFTLEFRGEELANATAFALIIVGIFCGSVYAFYSSELKNVGLNRDSDDYYREGSMEIVAESEEFLYKKIEIVDD